MLTGIRRIQLENISDGQKQVSKGTLFFFQVKDKG